MAPFPFIAMRGITINTCVLLKPVESRRYTKLHMHDLDFADDIALLATSILAVEKSSFKT